MHPTADTQAVINLCRAAWRVMPGVRFPIVALQPSLKRMKFETINLPKSERFACSANELKSALSDVEKLSVYCGVLGKGFAFDSRCRRRPILEGTVMASVQVSRELEAIMSLYSIRREEYPERAACEFRDAIIPKVLGWLKSRLAKGQTEVLGVEELVIEWTGREHRTHEMRFL